VPGPPGRDIILYGLLHGAVPGGQLAKESPMEKPFSAPMFNQADFPISIVRLIVLKGTGADIDELMEKPIIGIATRSPR
jgi:hypothetical protein